MTRSALIALIIVELCGLLLGCKRSTSPEVSALRQLEGTLAALEDTTKGVRETALEHILAFSDPSSGIDLNILKSRIEEHINQVESILLLPPDDPAVTAALKVYRRLGPENPALIDKLESRYLSPFEPEVSIAQKARTESILLIASLRQDKVVESLLQQATNSKLSEPQRYSALVALHGIVTLPDKNPVLSGDQLQLLSVLLAEPHPSVQETAIWILAEEAPAVYISNILQTLDLAAGSPHLNRSILAVLAELAEEHGEVFDSDHYDLLQDIVDDNTEAVDIRLAALRIIARLEEPSAESVFRLLAEDSPLPADSVLVYLNKRFLRREQRKSLIEMLRSSDPRLRLGALGVLERQGKVATYIQEITAVLQDNRGDQKGFVRRRALEVLGTSPQEAETYLPALLEVVDDDGLMLIGVRTALVDTFWRNRSVALGHIDELSKRLTGEYSNYTKTKAIEIIGGDRYTVGEVEIHLNSLLEKHVDPRGDLPAAIIRALGAGDRLNTQLPMIFKMIQEDPERERDPTSKIRIALLESLKEAQYHAYLPQILDLFFVRDREVHDLVARKAKSFSCDRPEDLLIVLSPLYGSFSISYLNEDQDGDVDVLLSHIRFHSYFCSGGTPYAKTILALLGYAPDTLRESIFEKPFEKQSQLRKTIRLLASHVYFPKDSYQALLASESNGSTDPKKARKKLRDQIADNIMKLAEGLRPGPFGKGLLLEIEEHMIPGFPQHKRRLMLLIDEMDEQSTLAKYLWRLAGPWTWLINHLNIFITAAVGALGVAFATWLIMKLKRQNDNTKRPRRRRPRRWR